MNKLYGQRAAPARRNGNRSASDARQPRQATHGSSLVRARRRHAQDVNGRHQTAIYTKKYIISLFPAIHGTPAHAPLSQGACSVWAVSLMTRASILRQTSDRLKVYGTLICAKCTVPGFARLQSLVILYTLGGASKPSGPAAADTAAVQRCVP